jgi:hypothetical protein
VPIESLRVGDRVLAVDPVTATASIAAVTDAYALQVSGVLAITVGTATIAVTREHPFWVPGSGWRIAGELSVGTTLQSESGHGIAITTITRRDRPTTVHNLAVAGVRTYLVSEVGVLVHNKSRGRRPAPTEADLPAERAAAITASLDADGKATKLIEEAQKAGDKAVVNQAWDVRNRLKANRDWIAEAETPEEFRTYEEWGQEMIDELDAIVLLRQPGEGIGGKAKWGNPKSAAAYGHSYLYHGTKREAAKFLEDAMRLGVPQGQFYDDMTIVLAERLAPLAAGAHDIDLARPIGRLYNANGTVTEYVTRVRVVRAADLTVTSSFPIP